MAPSQTATDEGDSTDAPSERLLPVGHPAQKRLRLGGEYNIEEHRETTRRQLALLLAILLAVTATSLIALTAVELLNINDAKELAASVLSPVVAVTGTALGFYFGGSRHGSG